LLFQQSKVSLTEVPWYTALSLNAALNPVPSSTFAPEVFPLKDFGICFQILPLMLFFTTSTVCFLQGPLHSYFSKWQATFKNMSGPVTPSAVMDSHGFEHLS